MNQKKPVVHLTRKLPDSTETRMRELFDARLNDTDTPRTNEELVAMVKEADVLVPTVTDRIDADLIAAAGDQLKLIASFGTGWTISTLPPPRRAASLLPTRRES